MRSSSVYLGEGTSDESYSTYLSFSKERIAVLLEGVYHPRVPTTLMYCVCMWICIVKVHSLRYGHRSRVLRQRARYGQRSSRRPQPVKLCLSRVLFRVWAWCNPSVPNKYPTDFPARYEPPPPRFDPGPAKPPSFNQSRLGLRQTPPSPFLEG